MNTKDILNYVNNMEIFEELNISIKKTSKLNVNINIDVKLDEDKIFSLAKEEELKQLGDEKAEDSSGFENVEAVLAYAKKHKASYVQIFVHKNDLAGFPNVQGLKLSDNIYSLPYEGNESLIQKYSELGIFCYTC